MFFEIKTNLSIESKINLRLIFVVKFYNIFKYVTVTIVATFKILTNLLYQLPPVKEKTNYGSLTTALPEIDLNVLSLYRLGITGRGVRIAVVDDGLEHTHDDLRNNYVCNICASSFSPVSQMTKHVARDVSFYISKCINF